MTYFLSSQMGTLKNMNRVKEENLISIFKEISFADADDFLKLIVFGSKNIIKICP